jgi:hypothetical protein
MGRVTAYILYLNVINVISTSSIFFNYSPRPAPPSCSLDFEEPYKQAFLVRDCIEGLFKVKLA